MERGTAVERHTEEQVCHQAQRGHNAGQGQLLGGKGALVQHTAEQDDDDHYGQQQPHCSCRHDFFPPIFFGAKPLYPALQDRSPVSRPLTHKTT